MARLIDAAAGTGAQAGRAVALHLALPRPVRHGRDGQRLFLRPRRETVEVIKALAAAPDKLPVLLGNSGVGKSSLAQAGVLAALARQAWPEARRMRVHGRPCSSNSRRWCFLTLRPGIEPIKALVETFLDTWQFDAGDPPA